MILCNQIKLMSACLPVARLNVMLMQSLASCSGKLHVHCCTVALPQATANHWRGQRCIQLISACVPQGWHLTDWGCFTPAEEAKRAKDLEAKKRRKAERKAKRAEEAKAHGSICTQAEHQELDARSIVAATPIAFVFPGQGSQAVGMLQVGAALPYTPVQPCTILMRATSILQTCIML